MDDCITAWQCIGCGNLEAPQTCIGVCEYRKVNLVHAGLFEAQQRELASLRAFVTRVLRTHPRPGAFEQSYNALQESARELLVSLSSGAAPQHRHT